MTALDATAIPALPIEIERLRRSRTWRRCRSEPFLGYYVVNLWLGAFHGVPAGSLDDDDDLLADLSGCPPLEWPRIRQMALQNWEKREDGRLYHKIVEGKARECLAVRSSAKRVVNVAHETPKAQIEAFELWWAEYPRKIAKGAARTAYERALKKAGAEVLLDGARRYARTVSLREPQYIPHPATWLNQERWIDGKRPDRPIVFLDQTVNNSNWNGKGERLSSIIGDAAFSAWFGGAEYLEGPPQKIVFPDAFKRDWASGHYAAQLNRVFGECMLEFVSTRPAK